MRNTIGLVLGLVLVAFASHGQEQEKELDFEDEQQYRQRMREIDHSFANLRGKGKLIAGQEVESEAAKLVELFEKVESFWKGRGQEQEAGFARMARDGAEQAREAARKRDQKGLDAAMETISASCEGCHREPLDKYRIKE